MAGPDDRCDFLLNLHAICAAHADKVSKTYLDSLRSQIKAAWAQIDASCNRVNMGFRIVAETAGNSPEFIEPEKLWDLCKILGKIESDSLSYGFFSEIVNNVEIKKNKNLYTREQRADLLTRLKGLLSKFPSPKFIQHEGYRILAEAQIGRLEKIGAAQWDELIARAKTLPNSSDQALVFSQLAEAIPASSALTARKRQLFADAKVKIEGLSSALDRAIRYEALAKNALDFDRQISRNALRAAIETSTTSDFEDASSVRRRLVDMAYRLDPDFAADISSKLDDDPVRKAKQTELQERLEILKLRDSLQTGNERLLSKKNPNAAQISEAAWMALRSLNSNKITAVSSEKARARVVEASRFPLEQAFAVLAFVIENEVRHYKETPQAAVHLRPLFKACAMGAELAYRISAKMRDASIAYRSTIKEIEGRSLIQAGERDRALEQIRSWVRNKVNQYVKICDPYFGLDDLELVRLIRMENEEVPIEILTSRKHQRDQGVPVPWDEAYQSHWRLNISETDPGEVKMTIVGTKESGAMPIHDRWVLSEGSGLRIGTSFNSLGVSKASEISDIAAEDFPGVRDVIEAYLNGKPKTRNGEKLLYTSFNLG